MCMSRLEETVNDADFIFEAVKEDMEIKKDLLESKYQQCWKCLYTDLGPIINCINCSLYWRFV